MSKKVAEAIVETLQAAGVKARELIDLATVNLTR
jgi:hypothetical protein